MKTIFNIAISIALGCSCASCSDFLNLTPYSEITAENFYQNEEDFRQAVNGAYEPLRNMYNTEEWNLGEAKSDNTTYIIHIAKSSLEKIRISSLRHPPMVMSVRSIITAT
jgi:hypothetical protein